MKKLVVILIALGIAYFFASPYLAVRGLNKALQSGDQQALEAHVDFPALRESLKAQMRQAVTAELGAEASADNPFAGMAVAFVSALVDPMVDSMVTPSGLSTLIKEAHKQQPAPDDDAFAGARMGLKGTSEFHVTVGKEADKSYKLVLLRKGLDWKLSRIELPMQELLAERKAKKAAQPEDSRAVQAQLQALMQANPQLQGMLPGSTAAQPSREAQQAEEEKRAQWQQHAEDLVKRQDELRAQQAAQSY